MPQPPLVKERKKSLKRSDLCFDSSSTGKTLLAGILNCTPDSFSDGGLFASRDRAVARAVTMAVDGADIIDVGGESTRPGSLPISSDEEIERVVPVIKRLRDILDIPISIDTSKASVAGEAIKSGASVVNDITGLKGDPEMAETVSKFNVPVILMHIKGRPATMQKHPCYNNLIEEIISGLQESISIARKACIDDSNIILDPGIGFGKTAEHNIILIKELYRFKEAGYPVMVGPSRKSFIGQILDRSVGERLMGTASVVALAIKNGADIVRVHDVKEINDVVKMADRICRS